MGAGGRVAQPPSHVRPRPLLGQHDPRGRGDRLRGPSVPLRRFRRHASHRGRRHLLAGDDVVDRGREGRPAGLRRDRGELARIWGRGRMMATAAPVSADAPTPPQPADPGTSGTSARPLALLTGAIGLVVSVWLVCNVFLAFAYYPHWFLNSKVLIGALSLVVGIGGAVVIFRFLNMIIEGMRSEERRVGKKWRMGTGAAW